MTMYDVLRLHMNMYDNVGLCMTMYDHLLAILYLIFEVNITQVSYVIQCIRVSEVQKNKV